MHMRVFSHQVRIEIESLAEGVDVSETVSHGPNSTPTPGTKPEPEPEPKPKPKPVA